MKEYFTQFGEIEDARVIFEKKSKVKKYIGFVLFKEEASVEKVLEKTMFHEIEGEKIECQRAMLREEIKQALIEEAKLLREKKKEEKLRLKEEKKRKKLEEKKRKQRMKRLKKQMKKMKKEEEEMKKYKKSQESSKKSKSREKKNEKKGGVEAQAVLAEEDVQDDQVDGTIAQAVLAEEDEAEGFNVNDERFYNVYKSFYTIGKSNNESQVNITPESAPFHLNESDDKFKGMERLMLKQNEKKKRDILGILTVFSTIFKFFFFKFFLGREIMGYPMGMFENSILTEGRRESGGKKLKNKYSEFGKNPLSGFGLFRELKFKTQSDVIKQKKLLNSLIFAHNNKIKSAIPKISSSFYKAYKDQEIEISVGNFRSVNQEERIFLSNLRDYSIEEDANEDEIEKLMKDFDKL